MDRLQIIEALNRTPDLVETEVAGLDEGALRFRPAEGQWSIKETAGHLRDLAEVWHKRLYSVCSLTDPLFVSFDVEAYVRDRAYQEAPLAETIAAMRRQRNLTVDLLAHAVDWTRLGQQPGVGRRSLRQFGELLLEHERDHIGQIRALKTATAS